MQYGPILIIEDDEDDKDFLFDALREIGITNRIIWLNNCIEAFELLNKTDEQTFLILCDVNLPKQTGTEFKKCIDEHPELRKKSIPFVFYSTCADQKTVDEAYTKMTVQGFFKKSNNYEEIKNHMKIITDYWMHCKHPNRL
ncbi:MAG: response regulator [Bacteroidota bacterium]